MKPKLVLLLVELMVAIGEYHGVHKRGNIGPWRRFSFGYKNFGGNSKIEKKNLVNQ